MADVNKVILLGNVGREPEVHTFDGGGQVGKLSVATTQSWKDKNGEWKEKTEWHNITTFNKGLIDHVFPKLSKGDRVYIEGVKETRQYEKDGVKHYMTEIVIPPFSGVLNKQRKAGDADGSGGGTGGGSSTNDNDGSYGGGSGAAGFDDDIPF